MEILGAWKDGALKKSDLSKASQFDPSQASFNGKWSRGAASVAFEVWEIAASELGGRMTDDFNSDAGEFLKKWSERQGKSGTRTKRFGLSRATTLLHFLSGGRYPIFDSRVRRAIKKLTGVTQKETVEWYLGEFCSVFDELTKNCAAESDRRKVDKALFAYGGKDKARSMSSPVK
ncbi:MAG TPA: hypothetical protein VKO18_16440 [Terriglobia bacterium]|nr:hypothetical protein [Terriglobia bacterium]